MLNLDWEKCSGAVETRRLDSSVNPIQALDTLHPHLIVNHPHPLLLQDGLSQLEESCLNINIGFCRSLKEFQPVLVCHLCGVFEEKIMMRQINCNLVMNIISSG